MDSDTAVRLCCWRRRWLGSLSQSVSLGPSDRKYSCDPRDRAGRGRAGGADKSRAGDTDGGHVSSPPVIQFGGEGDASCCLKNMSFPASEGGSVALRP